MCVIRKSSLEAILLSLKKKNHSHLVNPSDSNREIYESAHSVVLSMLVHDLQRRQELNSRSFVDLDDSEGEILWTRFIQCLVPFYAKCLVEVRLFIF